MTTTPWSFDRPVSKPVLFALALASSLLLPLALPNFVFNYGNPAVGIVCLVPLFIAVSLAPSFKLASLLGVVFGGVSTALAEFWLMFFQDFSMWTYGGVILGYIGYNALLFAFLRGFARIRAGYRPFILAAAWAFYEFLKSIGFLGNPWGLVAYPAGDFLPLIQFIDVTGIWGLSFLMALVNSLIAEGVLFAYRAAPPWSLLGEPRPARALKSLGRYGHQLAFGGFLLAIVLVYGFIRFAIPIPSEGTARLLLVQQNIDPWTKGKAIADSTRINEELSARAVAQAAEPFDLIVWSEGSVTDCGIAKDNTIWPEDNSLEPYAKGIGTYTLLGIPVEKDREKQLIMNGAALLTPEGKIADTYGKIHPVPFAESIPFFEFKAVQLFFRNVIGIWLPWTTGDRFTVFKVPLRGGKGLAFGAPICFEDAFSDLCRRYILEGADMWVNLTNDYWSKTVPSEVQHFQVAKFRAVENRRVLIRSTNGGVTAVVDPWGRTIAGLPLFERRTLAVDVPVYKDNSYTAYTLLGDYFPWCLGVAILVLLIMERVAAIPGARKRDET